VGFLGLVLGKPARPSLTEVALGRDCLVQIWFTEEGGNAGSCQVPMAGVPGSLRLTLAHWSDNCTRTLNSAPPPRLLEFHSDKQQPLPRPLAKLLEGYDDNQDQDVWGKRGRGERVGKVNSKGYQWNYRVADVCIIRERLC